MPVSYFSVENHALLSLRARRDQVAPTESELSRDAVICRNTLLEAHLPREREAFLEQRNHLCLIRLGHKEHLGQLGECMSNTPLVSRRPVNRQALLVEGARPGILTLAAGKQS